MKTLDLSDINIKGELAVRSGLNYLRLEGEWYRPDEVFQADKHGWPADWEGRVILALTLLAQSTHRTPAYLDEIIEQIPAHLNAKGYFGPILPDGIIDEQHVSGHSWIFRALTEYYTLTRDESIKVMMETMAKGFLLPLKGKFSQYPIEPDNRFNMQDVWKLSQLQTKTKYHAETSDAGCAFIMLDGVTAAYKMLRWPELKQIVEEIIERYMEMDLLRLNIQTHATLSAVRGILRFYELEKDPKYLDYAIRRYQLYTSEAWTEAYGNYNWFGAPRWTEPCAIIDSFIVTTTLWKLTRDVQYLEDAHHIYFNALCHGNRINGSFGSDICTGAVEADDNLFIAPVNYETYWCCTMRGGEGFTRAIEYNFFIDGNSVYLPYYNDCTATLTFDSGKIVVEEKTEYPYEGRVKLEVKSSTDMKEKVIKLFAPSWSRQKEAQVAVNGKKVKTSFEKGFLEFKAVLKKNDVVTLDFEQLFYTEDVTLKNNIHGYHIFKFGPMLLGSEAKVEINTLDGNRFENYAESKYKSVEKIEIPRNTIFKKAGKGRFEAYDSNIVLSCLCDIKNLTEEDSMKQVLFSN